MKLRPPSWRHPVLGFPSHSILPPWTRGDVKPTWVFTRPGIGRARARRSEAPLVTLMRLAATFTDRNGRIDVRA